MTSILGSLLYGWAANRIGEASILMSAAVLLLVSAFPAFHSAAVVPVTVAFAALAIFATGVLVASVFAAVPLVPSPDDIGPANGLIAQIGSGCPDRAADHRLFLLRLQRLDRVAGDDRDFHALVPWLRHFRQRRATAALTVDWLDPSPPGLAAGRCRKRNKVDVNQH